MLWLPLQEYTCIVSPTNEHEIYEDVKAAFEQVARIADNLQLSLYRKSFYGLFWNSFWINRNYFLCAIWCAALALKCLSDGYIRGTTRFICKCEATPVTRCSCLEESIWETQDVSCGQQSLNIRNVRIFEFFFVRFRNWWMCIYYRCI
jgi:hypothetical protein